MSNYKKVCSKCGLEKIAEGNFRIDNSKKDGYYSSCDACNKLMLQQYWDREGDRLNKKDREARARLKSTDWDNLNKHYYYDAAQNLVISQTTHKPLTVSSGSIYNTYYLPEFNCDCQLHRLNWMMVHKHWAKTLDHVNGDKKDNRLENLRECSSRENATNLPRHREGHLPGAHFRKDRNYWVSYARDVNGKRIYFKPRRTEREASLQYCQYALKHNLVRREFLPDIFTDEELGI